MWVCLYCDAWEYRGLSLGAYGNGERGVHIALEVRTLWLRFVGDQGRSCTLQLLGCSGGWGRAPQGMGSESRAMHTAVPSSCAPVTLCDPLLPVQPSATPYLFSRAALLLPGQMLLWSREVTLFTDGEALDATDHVREGGRETLRAAKHGRRRRRRRLLPAAARSLLCTKRRRQTARLDVGGIQASLVRFLTLNRSASCWRRTTS